MWKKLRKSISHILGTPAGSGRRQPGLRKFVPELEALADRVMPALLFHGNLYIYGTNGNDTVSVTANATSVKVTQNGKSQSFSLASVRGKQISFWGYDGNDSFTNSTALPATAFGMGGNDTLRGGS